MVNRVAVTAVFARIALGRMVSCVMLVLAVLLVRLGRLSLCGFCAGSWPLNAIYRQAYPGRRRNWLGLTFAQVCTGYRVVALTVKLNNIVMTHFCLPSYASHAKNVSCIYRTASW